ncbi:caspase family protein, partial [Methylorubrum suomiense]|uniref:caspase family protein n=1 Tax=Methylorubrum suomiense TaxID=144191 RepID=UPI00363BA868
MSWSSRILEALLCVVIGLAPGLLASAQDAARSQKRIALVIGNAAYEAGALATPANDAGLVAQTLQAAGFDVVGARDLDEDSLRKALRDFTDKAQSSGPDTVAFVYLAGYGLQLAGENYFVPVDARIPAAADVPSRALRLSDYTRQLAALLLAARVVVLDGARNAPFARTGDPLAGGLALTEAEPGSLIAFNASPGTVGPDEKGPYGAYATALVEMIREGGLAPAQVFDRVRLRVDETTKGAEVPWHSSRIDARFSFFERAADAPAIGRPEEVASLRARPLREIGARDAYAVCLQRDSIDGYQEFVQAYPRDDMAKRVRALIAARREAVTWRRTWMADSRDAYWSYLDRYPRGPHAWDARRRLRQLSAALEPPPRFVAISYDVPPPPPEEIVYVERPALYLDDPIYAFAPPPPPPPIFLPPPPAYIVELAPPPPPVAYYALPTPLFVPVPTYVSAPTYVEPPPNNVIYQNIHNVTVINTINERNIAISRDPGSPPAVSTALAAGAGAVAGAAIGAAAARVALPPAVAQKAALRGPPTNSAPGTPGSFGTAQSGNPQPGTAQPNTAQPGRSGPLPGSVPGQVAPQQAGQPQPVPPQAGRPGVAQPNAVQSQPGQPNTPLGVAGRNPPGQA